MKYLVSLSLSLLVLFFGAVSVHAQVAPPAFSSCPNPGGTLKVHYDTGLHGLVGQGEQSGSDSVYITGESTLVQCFCPESGSTGTQTNWWQVSELSQSDMDYFKSLGWVAVPDGSAWGLNSAFYFAYNTNFSCGGGGGGGFSQPGPGPAPVCTAAKPASPVLTSVVRQGSTATLTWTKIDSATHYAIWYGTAPGQFDFGVPNTGNVTSFTVGSLDPNQQYYWEVRAVNDCMPSDPAGGIGGGAVLGAFPPTGNLTTIIIIASLGLIFFGLSLLSRDHRRPQA